MHWKNSNFANLHFIIGRCHTPDEMYRVALQQLEEREVSLAHVKRFSFRRLWAEIRIALFGADAIDFQAEACVRECEQEIKFLKSILAKIQPHRKYVMMTDAEAFQAAQRDEWAQEFIFRAENFIAAQGAIPAAELGAMRAHPYFKSVIAPRIQSMMEQRARDGGLSLNEPAGLKLLGD